MAKIKSSSVTKLTFLYVSSITCVILSFLLSVLIAPSESPLQIEWLYSIFKNLSTYLSVFSWQQANHWSIFLFVVVFVFLVCFIGFSLRRKSESLISFNPRFLVTFVICTTLFLFTLFPSNLGWSMIIYLSLGSLAVLIMVTGVSIFLFASQITNNHSCIECLKLFALRNFFFKVSPIIFLGVLFIIEFILTNITSYFIFDNLPHIVDSIAQLFQGIIFSKGHLYASSPEYPEFFQMTHMIVNGKWYSQYPPGHSFFLMLGVLIDMPWIINPLFGSLTVVLLYFLGKEIYNEKIGRIASLLGVLSPFILFMSSEYMNHVSALFFFSLFLLCFYKTINRLNLKYSIVAGIAFGILCNIRPFTAASLSLPFIIYGVFLLSQNPKTFTKPFALMCLFSILFVLLLLVFNWLTNGNPFVFGYEALRGSEALPGFGRSGWGPKHTPLRGVSLSLDSLNALNVYLFEWPIPSLFFVYILLNSGSKKNWDFLLLFSFLSLAAAHFFYWYQDLCFGPRFYFEATVPLIILTARGLSVIPVVVRKVLKLRFRKNEIRLIILSVLFFCYFNAIAGNLPVLIKLYSNNYWGVNTKAVKDFEKLNIDNAIVFVQKYEGFFVKNSPLFDKDIIFARDLGGKNRLLMQMYPQYSYYLLSENGLFSMKKK